MDLNHKLTIFNTLGKQKQAFSPITDTVRIYHCGPTVYWVQHIGNMRAVYFADIVVRTLQFLSYKTTFVRNYTDVGHLTGDNIGDADSGLDRMAVASKRESLTPDEIAQKYIDIYTKDIKLLNSLPPNVSPKATEHISEMITMVQTLIEKDIAYITPEAVYFDVSKAHDYTRLSGQKIEFQEAGSGHGEHNGSSKRNPTDFALWFFRTGPHEHALQIWESPFESSLVENGLGFPGWHIECSAMSKTYLGDHFDIHIGGIEHIPVHHTNEIAQSECANGSPYVNYWLHNEHLLVDGAKMSKSEGTSFTLTDILEQGFTARELRFFFLQAHYRSKQNFTWDALQASKTSLSKIDTHISGVSLGEVSDTYTKRFTDALTDDFNTAAALSTVFDMMKDKSISKNDFYTTLIHLDKVLGIGFSAETVIVEIPENITKLANERALAKNNKDWVLADEIRTEIASLGYIVKDTKDGFSIEKSA